MLVFKVAYCSAVCLEDFNFRCILSLKRIDFHRPSLIQGFFLYSNLLNFICFTVVLFCMAVVNLSSKMHNLYLGHHEYQFLNCSM